MQNCAAADDQLSAWAWQTTLGMTILVVIWFHFAGLHVRIHVTPEFAFIPGYVFLTVYCRFIWQRIEVARMLITVGQLTVVVFMGLMLSYAASAVPFPYRDAELLAIDRWLGFERAAYLSFLARHPALKEVLYFAYATIMHQTLAVMLLPLVVRRVDRLQAYIIAFAFAVTATAIIAVFIPAANALIFVDKAPTHLSTLPDGGHSYFPTLEGLRAGTLRTIDFGRMEGLISFPSFHTANAILFVWALWPFRLLRPVLLALNILLVVSTPLGGAHYLVDLFGGALVAAGAIFLTNRLTRQSPATIPAPIPGEMGELQPVPALASLRRGTEAGANMRAM